MAKVQNTPGEVSLEAGEVLVDGPDGVAVAMTPEAAEETGHRLLDESARAYGQRILVEREEEERKERHSPTQSPNEGQRT